MAGQYFDSDGLGAITGISTPDNALMDTQAVSLKIEFRAAYANWDGGTQAIMWKWGATLDERSFYMQIKSGTDIIIGWLDDLDVSRSLQSDTFGLLDFELAWVKIELVLDNGANSEATFFEGGEDEEPVWVQVGAAKTSTQSSAINRSVGEPLELIGPSSNSEVDFYEFKIYRSIADIVPAVHFDADDFNVGDSDGDTAVGSDGLTYTLHDDVDLINKIAGTPKPVALSTPVFGAQAKPGDLFIL